MLIDPIGLILRPKEDLYLTMLMELGFAGTIDVKEKVKNWQIMDIPSLEKNFWKLD